jgi:hypothetical protein
VKITLLITGTGLKLKASLDNVASALLKKSADLSQFIFTNFGGYYDIESFGNYLHQFFPVEDPVLRKLFDYLKGKRLVLKFSILLGRYRFAAYFVSEVLSSQGFGSGEKLLLNTLDSIVNWVESKTDSLSPQHPLHLINIGQRNAYVNGEPILEIVRDLAFAYYFLGSFVATKASVLELVEIGICQLRKNGTQATLSEPLIALAIRSFFKSVGRPLEDNALGVLSIAKDLPSVSGLIFELYVIPRIVEYFSVGTLDKHPYFEKYKPFPKWAVGAFLDTPLKNSKVSSWLCKAPLLS